MSFSGGLGGGVVGRNSGLVGGVASGARVRSGMPLGLSLNSVNGTLLAAYRGRDATLTTWPARVGQAVTLGGASTNPTLNVATGKANPDDAIAVTFSDPGNYYQAAGNAYLDDDGVSDYVFEFVVNLGAATGTEDTVVGKYVGSTNSGFLLYRTPAGTFTGTGLLSVSDTFAPSTWNHGFCVSRRGGNCRNYMNGSFRNSLASFTFATAATPFQINGYSAAHSSPGGCSLAWFAMWSGTNLANGTTAEMDAVALARSKAAGF